MIYMYLSNFQKFLTLVCAGNFCYQPTSKTNKMAANDHGQL